MYVVVIDATYMKTDKTKIREILDRQGHKDFEIDQLLKNFPDEINDKLRNAYLSYLDDQSISNVIFDGVSLSNVMRARRSSFFIALRDINKFLNTPEDSLERKKWKKILTTPIHVE